MSFSFRPARRENVGLLIGLAGPSGSGKTMTGMRIAKGICGENRFAVIDSENRRALHYADFFAFDHGDLQPPFTPDNYANAIRAADDAGYHAILIDCISHEHAGEGGLIDWHEAELQRMAGDDWTKRERCNMAAWIKPKIAHKAMMAKLLRTRAHLILCFRADPKVKLVKETVDGKEKTVIVDAGFQPICEKNMPYEMTISFLLSSEVPGAPIHPLKLQKQHEAIFLRRNDEGVLYRIDESCGQQLSAWARGAATTNPSKREKATV